MNSSLASAEEKSGVRTRGARWLFANLSTVLVTCLALGAISCGGSDSDAPTDLPKIPITSTPHVENPSPNGSPTSTVTDSTQSHIPTLTAEQEAEAVRIAQGDPVFRQLTEGTNPTVRVVGVWTRTNPEMLGAAIEFELATPGSYDGSDWPEITNKDELYGENHDEEGDLGPVEPNVRPEIGTTDFETSDVNRISVLVDLESGQVAEILAM